MQQPGQGDLPGGRAVPGGDRAECVARASRQGPIPQRKPRQKRDALLLAQLQHVLGGAVQHVVAVLHRGDGGDLAGPGQLGRVDGVQADVPDLALPLEVQQRAQLVGHRHVRVEPVQLVEAEGVGTQTAQARFAHGAQVRRAACDLPAVRAGTDHTALRRDHQPLRVGVQGAGHQLLGHVRAVVVGGVDQRDAVVDGAAQQRDGAVRIVVPGSPVAGADEPAGAEAEPPDRQIPAEGESGQCRCSIHEW